MTAATHPYAAQLGDRDPTQVLAETLEAVPALAVRLGDAGMRRNLAPGKWNAAQILAHLADSELAFGFRVRQVLAEDNHVIQAFDQDAWAKHYDRADGRLAAEVFRVLRAWNLALFRLLSKDELARVATHPERGPETAATILRIIAGHTLNHLAQLEKLADAR